MPQTDLVKMFDIAHGDLDVMRKFYQHYQIPT